jgi:hypothetical protein
MDDPLREMYPTPPRTLGPEGKVPQSQRKPSEVPMW